ncbi:hypothetical protein VP01_2629g4 [Puccinia sorghi]|uniref:Uncharacterized protein n=1 Tax=Puccinia sorghi TaxID=27349 RepID=A0A0L6V4C0_9BASI|nr:hypothetical protein VP01_2629g4 [Puccinia sorghi]
MASSPSLTDLLKQLHDPDINPFPAIIHQLDAKKNPPVDAAQANGLLLSIATYNIIFLVCVAIICLPYLQGSGRANRRHWFIKRQYLDGHRSPYWIPNSGLVVAVCHMFGSILFLVFLGLRYGSFRTGFTNDSFYGSACYISFFTQAWSTWFVRASDATLKGKRNRIHPMAFNINLIGFPVMSFVMALVSISAQVAAMSAQDKSYRIMITSLDLMSHQWHPGQHFLGNPQFLAASTNFTTYRLDSAKRLAKFRATGLFWTFMAVPTFIFYMFGISTLLRVMYKRFQAVRDSDSEIVSTVSSSDSFKKRLKNNYPQNAPNQLPTSFIHLAVHYTMMSVTLFYHIIIGFIFYLSDNTRMADHGFLGLFMVLSNSGSYLLLAALLVQLVSVLMLKPPRKSALRREVIWQSGQSSEQISSLELKKSGPDIKLMT